MRGTERLAGALEAYLFIHGSPVKRKELAAVMQEDDRRVQEALDVLAEKYGREDSGIQLHETGAGIALATKKEYDAWLSEAAGEKFSVPSVCVQPQTDVCARVDACAENGNADAGDSPIASVGADETARTENGDGSACGSKDGKAKRGKDGCGAVRRTSIGGQAVLEGVMMKSATTVATAVRTATGAITVESRRLKPLSEKSVFFRLPFNWLRELFSA